ncbi:unnamed protein product [Arctogadus glacialis]
MASHRNPPTVYSTLLMYPQPPLAPKSSLAAPRGKQLPGRRKTTTTWKHLPVPAGRGRGTRCLGQCVSVGLNTRGLAAQKHQTGRPHGAFLLPSMACTVVACPSTCWSAGLSACLLANASLGVSTQTRDRLLEQLFHLGEFPSAWKYTAHHHGSSGLSRAGREAGRLGGREEGRKEDGAEGGRQEDRKEGREARRPGAGREGCRKTGREGGRETLSWAEREERRQTGRGASREGGRKTGRETGRRAGRQEDREGDRKTGRETGRQGGRQEDGQGDRKTGRETGSPA